MGRGRTYRMALVVAMVVLGVGAVAGLSSALASAQESVPAAASVAQANTGPGFTYQGVLADGGTAVDGVCDFTFSLWDAETEGLQVGATQTETTVQVTDGRFTALVNAGNEFEDTERIGDTPFTGEARWLAIGVRCPAGEGSFTQLAPRQALSAAPVAHTLVPGALISGTGAAWDLPGFGLAALRVRSDAVQRDAIRVTAGGDGLQVDQPGDNGVYVNGAGDDGVYVDSPSRNGFRVESPGEIGLEVADPFGYGVLVTNAGFDGIRVDTTADDGVYVRNAGGDGVYVANPGGDGVHVTDPAQDGVYVARAAADGFAARTPGFDGLYVDSPGRNGVRVDSPGRAGLEVTDPVTYGVQVTNAGVDGLYVDSAVEDGVAVVDPGDDGVFVRDAGRHGIVVVSPDGYGVAVASSGQDGVYVNDADGDGVSARTSSADRYGGYFVNAASSGGGAGLYARGNAGSSADVVLGGNSASAAGDDGLIISDPFHSSSDIVLRANDNVVVDLDGDGGEDGRFEIRNEDRTVVWSVDENGNTAASGTKSAVVDAGDYGQVKLYAVESPESWFEDFGTATLVAGEATVAIEPVFAETVSLDTTYHVYLTPLGDCPLYVAEKAADAFTVRAMDGATCEIDVDYRIVAKRAGYEDLRLEPVAEGNGD